MLKTFLQKQDETFTGKQSLENRAHICQMLKKFGKICQFHQHFTRAFCANIFAPKNHNAKM